MTLAVSPAWNDPTVTTARSPGATSRATTDCTRWTNDAAMTIGSTVVSGREPWPPLPWKVISRLSAAAMHAPGQYAISPAPKGATCWASTTSGVGTIPSV